MLLLLLLLQIKTTVFKCLCAQKATSRYIRTQNSGTVFVIHLPGEKRIYLSYANEGLIHSSKAKSSKPHWLINHGVGVTGTGAPHIAFKNKFLTTQMAETQKHTTKWHKLSLISARRGEACEQGINHSLRGARIKRHKRNETERGAHINMRTRKH